jgi:hypothetical protein
MLNTTGGCGHSPASVIKCCRNQHTLGYRSGSRHVNGLWVVYAPQGDWSDLSLTFTITHEVYGSHREVELKPGGKHIPGVCLHII